jgi:hypothetical protein
MARQQQYSSNMFSQPSKGVGYMLTELLGKGGQVCQLAKSGELRCPLIVRPTSEDVITGHLFNVLRVLNPRWWLPDLLNTALGENRFRRQVFRRLKIEPWKNCPAYPRELLPWNEGSTQVDVAISWENPPTTVFIEMKYGAELSPKTAGDDGRHGFPSDQLIRNIRVGLLECGWLQIHRLIDLQPRDFVVLVIGPKAENKLVAEYRNVDRLKQAIPKNELLRGLPGTPFVGEATYKQIVEVLINNKRWMTRAERLLADNLADYLLFKSDTRPGNPCGDRQAKMNWTEESEANESSLHMTSSTTEI